MYKLQWDFSVTILLLKMFEYCNDFKLRKAGKKTLANNLEDLVLLLFSQF